MRGPNIYVSSPGPIFPRPPLHDARISPEFLGVNLVGQFVEFKRSLGEGLTIHPRDGVLILPG